MNIHHLELFYYVARHGGISEAVRNMPYGIQQPAMSGQIIQLEEFLGGILTGAAAKPSATTSARSSGMAPPTRSIAVCLRTC